MGMYMDYLPQSVPKILMTKYLDKVMEEFLELITKTSHTRHIKNLFKVQGTDKAEYVCKDMAQAFYLTIASLLFVSS